MQQNHLLGTAYLLNVKTGGAQTLVSWICVKLHQVRRHLIRREGRKMRGVCGKDIKVYFYFNPALAMGPIGLCCLSSPCDLTLYIVAALPQLRQLWAAQKKQPQHSGSHQPQSLPDLPAAVEHESLTTNVARATAMPIREHSGLGRFDLGEDAATSSEATIMAA